jgi:hypothetical protein
MEIEIGMDFLMAESASSRVCESVWPSTVFTSFSHVHDKLNGMDEKADLLRRCPAFPRSSGRRDRGRLPSFCCSADSDFSAIVVDPEDHDFLHSRMFRIAIKTVRGDFEKSECRRRQQGRKEAFDNCIAQEWK